MEPNINRKKQSTQQIVIINQKKNLKTRLGNQSYPKEQAGKVIWK